MTLMTRQKQIITLISWMVIVFVAALVGSMATMQAGSFYSQLIRPDWAPPGSVFGPVWTVLYILMALAAWLVARTNNRSASKTALTLFLVQLSLNMVWSWFFFAWNYGALSFLNIVLLWGMIVLTLFSFWKIKPLAGVLMVPYLLWVSFALALNYAVWQLNPQIFG